MTELAIRLRGVVKRYGPITAVDGSTSTCPRERASRYQFQRTYDAILAAPVDTEELVTAEALWIAIRDLQLRRQRRPDAALPGRGHVLPDRHPAPLGTDPRERQPAAPHRRARSARGLRLMWRVAIRAMTRKLID